MPEVTTSNGRCTVETSYDGGRLEVVARYYGRVAADMIDAAVDRAIREEVGRLLVGKPEFKKAIHRMALEKLGEALLRP